MKKFKKCRTRKDIENDPRVDKIWHENEGFDRDSSWWCYLKPGWQAYGNYQHAIHEETIKGVCEVLEDVTEYPDDPELEIN